MRLFTSHNNIFSLACRTTENPHKLLLLLVLLLLFSNVYSQNQQNELTEVRLKLIYKIQFQFAGYIAAIEKGFYKDKGLNVALIDSNYQTGSAQYVTNGEAEFGLSTSGLAQKRAEGYPVVLLNCIFQHSPQALITSDASDIQNVSDLVGKRLMVESHAIDIQAFLKDEGITEDRYVNVPFRFDINSLISGEVDGISVYLTDQVYQLDAINFGYKVFTGQSGGIDFYGESLFTSEAYLNENPEVVAAFLEATKEGWNYALANKEEMIDIMLEKYNVSKSREHLIYEAERVQRYIANDVVEIGYYNKGRWSEILDTYKRLELVDEDANLDGFFYDEYQDKAIQIPWYLLFVSFSTLVLLSSVIFYVGSLNKRLRIQLDKSRILENTLRTTNDTKDRLISILAHDLKNPFSGIISLSSLMLVDIDSTSKQELKRSIKLIRKSAEDAYRLLKNLLDWLIIQQDGIKIRSRRLKLLDEIGPLLDLKHDIAANKGIHFKVEVEENLSLYTDPHMLEVIIRNLLANALKFTPKGGTVIFKVEDIESNNENKVYRFQIIDTGIGVSTQDQYSILNNKETKSRPGTENEKGTGLGLRITQDFINELGSKLRISSQPNKGSNFYFDLVSSI